MVAQVQAGEPSALVTLPGEQLGSSKQNIRCQYPGCNVDLSKLRRFNMRCKICDFHAKADSVMVEGIPQRFCQQCNKFHPVAAFDGTKRGCREKLDKHNKRRRNHRSKENGGKEGDSKRTKKGKKGEPAVEAAPIPEMDAFGNAPMGSFPPFQGDFQHAAAVTGGQNGGAPYAAGMQNYLAQLSQHAAAAWAAQASALNFGGAAPPGTPGAPNGAMSAPPAPQAPPVPEQYIQKPPEQPGIPDPSLTTMAPGQSQGAALSPEQLQRYMLLASYANYMNNGHP